MFCYKCGKEINEEMVFCPFCGVRLENMNEVMMQTENALKGNDKDNCKNDDLASQYYLKGINIAESEKERATFYLEKAAEMGCAAAICALGNELAFGTYVIVDYKDIDYLASKDNLIEAEKKYKDSYEKGYFTAKRQLLEIYFNSMHGYYSENIFGYSKWQVLELGRKWLKNSISDEERQCCLKFLCDRFYEYISLNEMLSYIDELIVYDEKDNYRLGELYYNGYRRFGSDDLKPDILLAEKYMSLAKKAKNIYAVPRLYEIQEIQATMGKKRIKVYVETKELQACAKLYIEHSSKYERKLTAAVYDWGIYCVNEACFLTDESDSKNHDEILKEGISNLKFFVDRMITAPNKSNDEESDIIFATIELVKALDAKYGDCDEKRKYEELLNNSIASFSLKTRIKYIEELWNGEEVICKNREYVKQILRDASKVIKYKKYKYIEEELIIFYGLHKYEFTEEEKELIDRLFAYGADDKLRWYKDVLLYSEEDSDCAELLNKLNAVEAQIYTVGGISYHTKAEAEIAQKELDRIKEKQKKLLFEIEALCSSSILSNNALFEAFSKCSELYKEDVEIDRYVMRAIDGRIKFGISEKELNEIRAQMKMYIEHEAFSQELVEEILCRLENVEISIPVPPEFVEQIKNVCNEFARQSHLPVHVFGTTTNIEDATFWSREVNILELPEEAAIYYMYSANDCHIAFSCLGIHYYSVKSRWYISWLDFIKHEIVMADKDLVKIGDKECYTVNASKYLKNLLTSIQFAVRKMAYSMPGRYYGIEKPSLDYKKLLASPEELLVIDSYDADLIQLCFDTDKGFKEIFEEINNLTNNGIGKPQCLISDQNVHTYVFITESYIMTVGNDKTSYTPLDNVIMLKIDYDEYNNPCLFIYYTKGEGFYEYLIIISQEFVDINLQPFNDALDERQPFKHANYYRTGTVVKKDLDKAIVLYKKVSNNLCDKNRSSANYYLGAIYAQIGDLLSAISYYLAAAEIDKKIRPAALYEVAIIEYASGEGVNEDSKHYHVVYCMDLAAQNKYKDARERLISILTNSEWMKKAQEEAKREYKETELQDIIKREGRTPTEYVTDKAKEMAGKVKDKFSKLFNLK